MSVYIYYYYIHMTHVHVCLAIILNDESTTVQLL